MSPRTRAASFWAVPAIIVGLLWVTWGEVPGLPEPTGKAPTEVVEEQVDTPTADEGAAEAAQDLVEGDGQWVPANAPNYYEVTGAAEVGHPELVAGEYFYEGFDELGRTRDAAAMITHDTYRQARERGRQPMPSGDPTGWGHNFKTTIEALGDANDYHGYFWNRSHLIADSLGGDAEVYNLVTGTRPQNVGIPNGSGGMAYTENLAWDYLGDPAKDGCPLYYAASPTYEDDELVPRTVEVDILSCDASIDEHVTVYNAAFGYWIDYATGEVEPHKLGVSAETP